VWPERYCPQDVVVPTFIRHIEVLDGVYGAPAAGFPFSFPNSAFYASPLVYDINYDGEPDLGVTTFNGELVWLSETGMPIFGRSLKIPHLRVRKNWFEGLKADPQDMEHTGMTEFQRQKREHESMGRPGKDVAAGNFRTLYDQYKSDPHQIASDFVVESDKDGSGTVERVEFLPRIRKMDLTLSRTQIADKFREIDADGDGKLSIAELMAKAGMIEDLQGSSNPEMEFYRVDTDPDGYVSLDELMARTKEHPGGDEGGVVMRFRAVDEDRDGRISMEEAKKLWDLFDVRSTWTDPETAGARRARLGEGVDRGTAVQRATNEMLVKASFATDSLETLLRNIGLGLAIGKQLEAVGVKTPSDLLDFVDRGDMHRLELKPVEEGKILKIVQEQRVLLEAKKKLQDLAAQLSKSIGRSPPAEPPAPPPQDPPPRKEPRQLGTGTRRPSSATAATEPDSQGPASGASAGAGAAGRGGPRDGTGGERQAATPERLQEGGQAGVLRPAGPASERASRRLLQDAPTGGDAGSDVGGDAGAGAGGDAGVDAGDAGADGAAWGDGGGPPEPQDGQEFVDGEHYEAPVDDLPEGEAAGGEAHGHEGPGSLWDDDGAYDEYYDRYHYGDPDGDDQLATRIAQAKHEMRAEGWKDIPLSAPTTGQWANLKQFFAPEQPEQLDVQHGGEHLRSTIVGHDEVFTRAISFDRHVLLTANRKNSSAPLPGDRPKEEGYVFVDAHVLCTPIIADLDRDGRDEIIFAVSYYFDKEQYSDPAAFTDLEVDTQIKKYVAGGVVVYDVGSGKKKWDIHLDLTTDETMYRAYIYSSPTVADLNGDGKMEVILGTSLGFIYAIQHDGKVMPNFPITMAELQGQVAVGDINDDGHLELVASDSRNNVAVFKHNGDELWERQITGSSSQGPTLGDVNGDGTVDVIVCTTSGHIHAMDGKTGEPLRNFPVRAGGMIMSPPLLLNLKGGKDPSSPTSSKSIIVPAHDGYLYIVDGASGCTFKHDIGENSYSMVLADDLTGNGKMDLVVTTMNGNVIVLGTDTPYHPLKAWTSREIGNNNVELRDGRQGIFVRKEYRTHRDNSGATMMLGASPSAPRLLSPA